MGFIQSPPRLGNQYEEDRVLRGYLSRALPNDELRSVTDALHRMGELVKSEAKRS